MQLDVTWLYDDFEGVQDIALHNNNNNNNNNNNSNNNSDDNSNNSNNSDNNIISWDKLKSLPIASMNIG